MNRYHKSNLGVQSWFTPTSDIEYVDTIDRGDVLADCLDANANGQEARVWESDDNEISVAFFDYGTEEGELFVGKFWCDIDGYCYGEQPEDPKDEEG